MYETFYGLRERPFDLTPNPRFLYLSPQHREALSTVKHAILGRKGITLFIGDAGTGKTTILRTVLGGLEERARLCVYLNNPALTRSEFYEFLAAGFRLSTPASMSKAKFLIELERLVRDRSAQSPVALIIDEAQSLPLELLEEVRLLANLETTTDKLLPVVLAGQPELAASLERPEMRQFKQRIGMRCDLSALDLVGTAAYVAGRIRIAGGDIAQVFTRDAIVSVYDRSHGIPRIVSVICENALIAGFALDAKPIGRDIVLEVCRDFRFEAEEAGLGSGAPTPRTVSPAASAAVPGIAPAAQRPMAASAGTRFGVADPAPSTMTPAGQAFSAAVHTASDHPASGATSASKPTEAGSPHHEGAPSNGNGNGHRPQLPPVTVLSIPPAAPQPETAGEAESATIPAEAGSEAMRPMFEQFKGRRRHFLFF